MRKIILICFAWASTCQAQDSVRVATPDYSSPVRVTSSLDAEDVAQNRARSYTVTVNWQGDLDRFEVVKVETPVLTNLDVVATASSNWVGDRGDGQEVVKTYEFTLAPQEMGMAYIDGALVEYRDNAVDRVERLMTNRIAVRVTEPILERDTALYLRITLGILMLGCLAVVAVITLRRRRRARAESQAKETEQTLEERYLDKMRTSVLLGKQSNSESFAILSRMLRKYLSEKCDLSLMGMSTDEVRTCLLQGAVDREIVEHSDEVLRASDVARFSGGDVDRASLDRAYTLVEGILQNGLDRRQAGDSQPNETLQS